MGEVPSSIRDMGRDGCQKIERVADRGKLPPVAGR